jgi:hypothetical protein
MLPLLGVMGGVWLTTAYLGLQLPDVSDVFISYPYSADNLEWVTKNVYQPLSKLRVPYGTGWRPPIVFLDHNDEEMRLSDEWWPRIEAAIDQCKARTTLIDSPARKSSTVQTISRQISHTCFQSSLATKRTPRRSVRCVPFVPTLRNASMEKRQRTFATAPRQV